MWRRCGTIMVTLSAATTSNEPKLGAAAGSCWSVGFTFESCCAPDFGPEGNTECWDDVYTYDSCCQGGDPHSLGCNSSYFRRFRNLAFEYYNLGRSKPALIELWPRILANYDARFLLCPPAALQAQLLQIEERGFLERPETVTEQLLGVVFVWHLEHQNRMAHFGMVSFSFEFSIGFRLMSMSVQPRLLSYTRNLQHAFTSQDQTAGSVDFDAWPLELGLDRLRQNSRIKAQQRRFRRFPDVTLVLSYCG